ncbi:hypothetical protein KC19_11G081100 [Ceratodon purpureus]|nr:hypothetical protein KC19_11G081100 [Ceratodon purpureus]
MWSKEEVAEAGVGTLVVGGGQEKVLKSFLVDAVDVQSQQRWVHAPGHRCTDTATSPEPYWHDSWQIAGMECEDLQTPTCSATLIVSLSDRNAKTLCGGVAVFPRSHWIVQDRISDQSLPQPCDLPAAVPMELRLECGDMALLHPLLAYTIAPNTSSSPAQFLVLNLGNPTSNQVNARVDEGKQMWSGWHSMEDLLTGEITSSEEEMVQLKTEEGKAQLGGWQNSMTGLTTDQLSLASSLSTRASPRDLLAWHLRASAVQSMQDGQWSNALSMLLRRAGLRPNCYWTAFQAGRCCMKSAPAGQLGGRAGRKCTLEDGERFLLRAIEMAPGWPLAYAELMKCLELMGRGREQEVSQVMEVMKQHCNFQQLCLRYPIVSDMLEECWNDCETLSHRLTLGERA